MNISFRRLNWVTAAHLECPFSETAPGIRDLVYQAINDILQVDGFKAPQDNLESVVRCSKKIFEVIQAGKNNAASADDFLPSLVFILLKANPPRIHSNINFISRFSNESRLRSGEEAYYFTSLCCALSFIENLTEKQENEFLRLENSRLKQEMEALQEKMRAMMMGQDHTI